LPVFAIVPRPEKVKAVEEIKEVLGYSTVYLMDYTGLDVKTFSAVRNKLRESGTQCMVVKNTLFRRAAVDTPASPLSGTLAGATALVYTNDDPVEAAKLLMTFTKGPRPVHVKAGVVEGQVVSAATVEALSKAPSKPELLAMVVGGLQSPITNLVGTLQGMTSQLVFTLQALAEKKAA
jgi:large subunit ribosomal protein L10